MPVTRRDEVFNYICGYAGEMNGVTPSMREIARDFDRSYTTIYRHVRQLIKEGRLDIDGRKILIPGSVWLAPDDPRIKLLRSA